MNIIDIENKANKFSQDSFDDKSLVPEFEQIFFDNPIYIFQAKCLDAVLYLCGWNKRSFANILNVSDSTVNNILANESMTNNKPTCLSRCQFISILYMIQTKKVKQKKNVLVVFYLFSWLCCGLRTELNFDKYKQLFSLESSELDRQLFFKVINNLCPGLFHSFNLFIDWRFNAPDISMSEYFGGRKNEPFGCGLPWDEKLQKDSEEIAIKKAMKNVDKFIPKYLEWYTDLIGELV